MLEVAQTHSLLAMLMDCPSGCAKAGPGARVSDLVCFGSDVNNSQELTICEGDAIFRGLQLNRQNGEAAIQVLVWCFQADNTCCGASIEGVCRLKCCDAITARGKYWKSRLYSPNTSATFRRLLEEGMQQ